MELKLYDTLTKEKRAFAPLDPSNVRMYVCGPTVYDFAHIGNARPVIVFDVLFRLLRHIYGADHVTYVRNITDVDDKINDRAARDFPGLALNEAIRKVTEQTEKQFHADVDALGCLRPSVEPRATEHIGEMRAIIEKLIANKNAYVEQDHVLFSVATDSKYGSLARRSLDEMLAGARVDVAPYKRAPMDFVLWKPSKPGEPSWPSPAGIKVQGRPGWHIECSAMADKLLWEDVKFRLSPAGLNHPHQFDIHGGGIDLVFPHHENEMAQSCCAFHTSRMANVWMHNGFLQVEGEKMSKSTGNFITINELLTMDSFGKKVWAGNVVRVAMLKTHYRQPIDWTVKRLWEAEDQVVQWELLVDRIIEPLNNPSLLLRVDEPDREVMEALADDLNTHRALDRIYHLANEVKRAPEKVSVLISSLRLLGIEFSHPYGINPANARRRDLMEKVEPLIMARELARARKDFAESDRIRDELAAMGIAIKDGKDSDGKPVTTWEVAR